MTVNDPSSEHKAHAPKTTRFAILTASDSRGPDSDGSGDTIEGLAREAGHEVVDRTLVRDELIVITAAVKRLLADPNVDLIVTTGGTGVAPRDVTIEAIEPLFERALPGFGELFRALSYREVGSAAMLSRAAAGIVQGKPVFLLPGSPDACRLAMEKLILPETGHLLSLVRRS